MSSIYLGKGERREKRKERKRGSEKKNASLSQVQRGISEQKPHWVSDQSLFHLIFHMIFDVFN